jgi:NAD(P)-dependent dehydrogenase (short-subunit alcohol dehydrogenase family)
MRTLGFAGVGMTNDGFAEMMAVNYFAPWFLTMTLRETLVRFAPARIVTVASEASRQSGVGTRTVPSDTIRSNVA